MIEVHPGVDEVVRVVTISTSSGSEMKHPTVKLCLLATEADAISVKNQNFLTEACRGQRHFLFPIAPKAIPQNRRTRNNINRLLISQYQPNRRYSHIGTLHILINL